MFRVEGVEHQGEARELSTCGTFVTTKQQGIPEELELLLQAGGDTIPVSGEVVRVTPEGFSVAFHALHPEILTRLVRLLRPGMVQTEARKPSVSEEDQAAVIQVQGEDWIPPVTEPTLHQWKPQVELAPPPPGEPQATPWGGLPTITPLATPGEAVSKTIPATPAAAAVTQPASSFEPWGTHLDRRLSERTEQSIPVTFDSLTTLIKEFTHNISFGGLFVYTDRPLQKGEETAVTLVHPVHNQRLTLLAKVVHSATAQSPDPVTGSPRYGVGVEFRIPIEDLKQSLSDFISSHKKPAPATASIQVVQEARAIMGRGAGSPHELLGVRPDASPDEIRRAYFQMVDRFHPDRYFGKATESDQKVLEELFRGLTKAYEELTA